ncbi:hemin ABC transporter substrate-binding protein [Sphingobacterium mizutaii]|uniref:heme/hemin ABC transporter substrate-binding protein n=1 Tax=Sphingobacterium mizutaii TaxID=1010 RepID=UPI0016299FF8|nr:ABC transporter substrate-binding protein [Sphingobacterium mizutaii]
MKIHLLILRIFGILLLVIAGKVTHGQTYQRIVSLNGSISEVLDGMGLARNIVAVDVTSDFPESIAKLPKVSKNRSLTIESIGSFRPDLVLALKGEVSSELQAQIKSLKIPIVMLNQDFTFAGLNQFILDVGKAVNQHQSAIQLSQKVKNELNSLKGRSSNKGKKILFIYARGAGYMSVAGQGTAIDAVIRDSGFQNAMKGFKGYKTYNTEALVAANPDVILLFDFGMSSLGGAQTILNLPGVKLTNAGKNKKIIAMDASLLNNYSLRLPQAIGNLQKLVN